MQSYRHTHYGKKRYGITGDFEYTAMFGDTENVFRGGIWYEDNSRHEHRDWHKITDTRIPGAEFDDPPYWTQYDRKYPQTTLKWYLEDSVTFGPVTAIFGVKQFLVGLERQDLFGDTQDIKVNSDSEILFSGGVVWVAADGFELFAGFAENFKPFSDNILERPASDFGTLEPETAENYDIGLRYWGDRFGASLNYCRIKFSNRIIFLDNEGVSGPNFLIGTNGTYFNAGGIESNGFEFSGEALVSDALSLYASYTYNHSKYLGTGDELVDSEVGITPGNSVVNQPEHMFVVSADWQKSIYRAGVSAKYTGSRFVRFDNTWATNDYITTDIYIGVSGADLRGSLDSIDMSLVVNNVFDVDYLAGIAGQGAWIGAPRTVTFTLTTDF